MRAQRTTLLMHRALFFLSCSEESRSVGLEEGLHALGGSSLHGSNLREAKLLVCHLDVGGSLEVLVLEAASSDDLDGFSTSGVAASHLEVHLGDGTTEGGVSVFLVHVDGAGTGVVSEEDAVVLEGSGLLLVDL